MGTKNRGICNGCGRERYLTLKVKRLCDTCYSNSRPPETCCSCGKSMIPVYRDKNGAWCQTSAAMPAPSRARPATGRQNRSAP